MKGEIKAQWIDLQQNGEERTGKLKIEITQSELQGENRKRKMNKTSQGKILESWISQAVMHDFL